MSTTARPMRADAARNRRLLLDAARDAFTRRGVTASLDDVARAAGVGSGTLHRHFPTRDELVLAVIDDGLTDMHRLGIALVDAEDPLHALHHWLDSYIEQGSVFEGLARTLATPRRPQARAAPAIWHAPQARSSWRGPSTPECFATTSALTTCWTWRRPSLGSVNSPSGT